MFFFNDISIYNSLVNQHRPRSFSGKPWVFPHVKWANRWANGLRCSLLIIIWVECAPSIFCSLNHLRLFNMNYMYMSIHVVVFSNLDSSTDEWPIQSFLLHIPQKIPIRFYQICRGNASLVSLGYLETWCWLCFLDLSSHFHDLPWFTNDLPIILSYNILILPNLPSGNLT